MSRFLDVSGLVINLAGVLILFRYGMPYRVATGGVGFIALEDVDQREIAVDKKYRALGLVGIALAIAGVGLQIMAAF